MNKTLLHELAGKLHLSAKTVYWLVVAMLVAFMFIPREYAYAQSASEALLAAEAAGHSPDANVDQAAAATPSSFPYTKTFVITGYYSPLPGQSTYITGSYESDKRLNGNGTNGADGTQVYPGMIAAPKEFPFGTKMKIPGIGTVAVHDRGGAIRTNRLDIWLGSGDEGLARALAWGKRSVSVTVYGIDASVKEDVAIASLPLADLSRIRVVYQGTPNTPVQKVYKDLAYGESGDEVRLMQEYLSLLGYFKGEATGYFDETTKDAVIDFQIDSSVIATANDPGAGIFGSRTRATFEAVLEKNRVEDAANIPTINLYKGKTGEQVKNLNYFLSEFGYLQSSHAGIDRFDEATEEGLKRMQYDMGVIEKDTDTGAGVLGPKTLSALKQLIQNRWNPGRQFAIEAGATSVPFVGQLNPGEQSEKVQEMQRMLRDLNFLEIQPNGYYGKTTEHAVFKFQQAFGIVTTETDDGAGVVGPRTLAKLNELDLARNGQKLLIGKTTDTTVLVAARLNDEKVIVASSGITEVNFTEHATYGMRGESVEQLQKVLKQLGFFQGKVTTDYFGDVTRNALKDFQKNHGLIETGELDDATVAILNKLNK